MPSPEQEHNREPGEQRETDADPYYRAARFVSERAAGRAYFRTQRLVYNSNCELSCFRFQLDGIYHVAILGEPPPKKLEQRLQRLLSNGSLVLLPPDILSRLFERRAEAARQGEWIERHFRPGQKA